MTFVFLILLSLRPHPRRAAETGGDRPREPANNSAADPKENIGRYPAGFT